MATQIIPEAGKSEEGTLTASLERTHTIKVPSFSTPDLSYKVNLEERSCDCKRFEIHGNCIKHVVAGQALARVRARKFYTTAMREMVEEQVFELCKRIFAPVCKAESLVDSYDLLTEVQSFYYKTPAIVEAARRRHLRVLAMHESKAA